MNCWPPERCFWIWTPGVKRGVVADGQVYLPAEDRHLLVLGEVQWIVTTGPAVFLGDHLLGQTVYLDGVVVVGLLGIVKTVKLLLDLELSVPVGAPGLDVQSREAEN